MLIGFAAFCGCASELTGVLVLVQPRNKLEWRNIELGIASVTHAGIVSGLREGELVALPGETPIAAGETVVPKLP